MSEEKPPFPKSPTQPLPGNQRDPEDEFTAGEFSDLEEPMPNFERANKANEKMREQYPDLGKNSK